MVIITCSVTNSSLNIEGKAQIGVKSFDFLGGATKSLILV